MQVELFMASIDQEFPAALIESLNSETNERDQCEFSGRHQLD